MDFCTNEIEELDRLLESCGICTLPDDIAGFQYPGSRPNLGILVDVILVRIPGPEIGLLQP